MEKADLDLSLPAHADHTITQPPLERPGFFRIKATAGGLPLSRATVRKSPEKDGGGARRRVPKNPTTHCGSEGTVSQSESVPQHDAAANDYLPKAEGERKGTGSKELIPQGEDQMTRRSSV